MPIKTIHVVAGIIVEQERVFIAKRNPGGPAGGMWEFPGGKVDPGERPEVALARELQEELNLVAKVETPLGLFDTQVGDRIIALDCYWVLEFSGELHLTSHSESRWVSVDELGAYVFAAPDLPAIALIQRLGLPSSSRLASRTP